MSLGCSIPSDFSTIICYLAFGLLLSEIRCIYGYSENSTFAPNMWDGEGMYTVLEYYEPIRPGGTY